MSYLNIMKGQIEQRLSFFRNKIYDEAKYTVKKNIERQQNIVASVFFLSLAMLVFGTVFSIGLKNGTVINTIFFYIIAISLMTFLGSMLFIFYLVYLESNKVRYFKKIYQKFCKGYCKQYRIASLEDDNSLRKILISFFEDEFLDNNTDTEIYQYLYEHRMLRSEELDKIDKFLELNNVDFRSYVLALDSELLAHIINPYRAEMKREIEDAVASFFLEKHRAKQEEERARNVERQKQNLFIEKTNGFASSMLGKNLAIQR